MRVSRAFRTSDFLARGDGAKPELPYNLDAEQELIGAIFINNDAYEKVSAFLKPEHFANRLHGEIYAACQGLIERGEKATPVTLKIFFDRNKALADIGGTAYLARLAAAATTIINAEQYGRAVRMLALRRELIVVASDLQIAASESTVDVPVEQIMTDSLARIDEMSTTTATDTSRIVSIGRAAYQGIQEIGAAYEQRGRVLGACFGIKSLDKELGGLREGESTILAGRPSMGKSTLAVCAAMATVRHDEPIPTAIFSLEMSRSQLVYRILAEMTAIPYTLMQRGEVTEEQIARIDAARVVLADLPLLIDDTAGLTAAAIKSRARQLKRRYGIRFVIADHMGKIRASRGSSVYQQVSEISRDMTELPKQLGIHLLMLHQLNRGPENREDKRPTTSDLRDSGNVEQDFDNILFIYRKEHYLLRKEPEQNSPDYAAWETDLGREHNTGEVIIDKQRMGAAGKTIRFYCDLSIARCADLYGGQL